MISYAVRIMRTIVTAIFILTSCLLALAVQRPQPNRVGKWEASELIRPQELSVKIRDNGASKPLIALVGFAPTGDELPKDQLGPVSCLKWKDRKFSRPDRLANSSSVIKWSINVVKVCRQGKIGHQLAIKWKKLAIKW